MEHQDALLAFVLISVPFSVFFLLGVLSPTLQNSTFFFTIVLGLGLPVLLILWLLQYLDQSGKIDFEIGPLLLNQNPGALGLLFGVGLGFITFIFNVAAFQFASPQILLPQVAKNLAIIYTPQLLSSVGSVSYPVLSNVTFDFILVGPAEESLKAAMMFGIYMLVPLAPVAYLGAGIAIFFWAAFHSIVAGFGLFAIVMAFISGSIWFGGWAIAQHLGEDEDKGGSILIPILAHGTYDSLVIGLTAVSVLFFAQMYVVFATLIGLAIIVAYIWKNVS